MGRKITIFSILLLVIIFVVLFIVSLTIKGTRSTQTPLTPTPNFSSPKSFTTPLSNELVIIGILPVENKGPYLSFQKITLSFNAPVSAADLVISTSPPAETNILQSPNPNELFIVPTSTWAIGKTNITILQAESSDLTKKLIRPVNYSITVSLPTLSPEELEKNYP